MDNKEYISGIYNYCDRWCEKCSFTSNCLLYTNESKIITHEILNNGDLTGIEKIFMPDFPDEDGEDDYDGEDDFIFNQEDITDEEIKPLRQLLDDMPPHSLELLADEYFETAHTFLNDLNDKFNLYPVDKDRLVNQEYAKLSDLFDVVSWYHIFIGAKIKRALLGKADLLQEDDEDVRSFTTDDINGSAKVASIGVAKSVESLNQMYNLLEEYHPQISSLLVTAGKIQNEITEEFPGYKEFMRPGLDDHMTTD